MYNIFHVIKDFFFNKLEKASKETIKERRSICQQCEARNNLANVCTVCGCYIPLKTKIQQSSCPMEKW